MTTREKILDAAQDLIQTRSFHGFSFQDVADRVGIRKASFYHYFDSKDAVALAVLERAADWVRTQSAKVDGEDPAARLEHYFEMFRDIHGKGERMCPGGSFASVFGGISSSVQSALHRFTKLHLDLLESIVREGAERGQFQNQRPAPARRRHADPRWRSGGADDRPPNWRCPRHRCSHRRIQELLGLRSHQVATMSCFSMEI